MRDNAETKKTNNIRLTIVVVTAIAATAAIISLIIFLIFRASGTEASFNYTAHDITKQVINKMNYENLSEISEDNIDKYYEIPSDVVSDSAVFISSRTDNFTELACFKLSKEEYEQKLLDVIEDYLSEKKSTYQNINEKAYNAIQESKVFTHYPYVLVSVSSDNNSVKSTFDAMFEEKSNSDLSED